MLLTDSELTYLELTAKHAPHELPPSSELVLRLLNELTISRAEEAALCEQVGELQNELSATEDWHKEDVRQLQHEIEDLLEKIEGLEYTVSQL